MTTKRLLVLITLLGLLWAGGATRPLHAQTIITRDEITFAQFGLNTQTMEGPFDTARYFFSLPANWRLSTGVKLNLDLEINAIVRDTAGNERPPRGRIQVLFDGKAVETIRITENGRQIINLDVPNDALEPSADGRFSIELNLDSGDDCELESETTVTIYDSSVLVLPHSLGAPQLDLSLLPRPFYQRSFEPDEVTIVIPDAPSTADLQAALTLTAGFGNLSSGKMIVNLALAGELPANPRDTKNLIFIGQPGDYPQLDEVDFSVPVSADGFAAAGAQENDGLLQLALSPWNEAGVVLLVSGQTDEALIKAAQAVSTATVQVSRRRNVAIVSSVRADRFVGIVSETERTLAQLGYGELLLQGLGRDEQVVRFFIPFGQVPSAETYLDLDYLHAAILDYALSGITLRLNDNLIGSLLLDETSTQLSNTRIPFPQAALRPGLNELRIESNLVPRDSCAGQNQEDLWFSIRPESSLFIPLEDGSTASQQLSSLQAFPDPFVYESTLAETAIVLPQADPLAWRTAARLAFYLGDQANSPLVDLTVAFANNVPDALRLNHHLLVVGQPIQLPILADLGEALPVAFEPESNNVQENQLPITYRLPRNASVGYVELVVAPWNPTRTVIVVAGRTAEGLDYAADALIQSGLRRQMAGDFASVVETQVLALNSRSMVNAPVSPLVQPVDGNLVDETGEITNPTTGAPDWVYPAMLGSVGLMGVVVVFVILRQVWRFFRRRRAMSN